MKKIINKLFSICLIIFTIIGSNTSIISYAMDNESGTQIRSIAVEYPGEKTEIVATKDWATVSLSLGISELASGETMTLRMASEKYSYSMTPFEIGDALQVIPNDDGTWTIKALQTLTDYSADLQLKLRYNQNLSEDFEDQVVFTFGDSQKIVKINIGQYVEKVPPTELVRKVPLGFTSEGRIAWVIYFNYNQAGLSGSEKTTFKFLDNVGPNQTLAIDSIAAYLTKQPILEVNGEMIRNLEHDEYSYDASQFFQKNASESGFNYEAEKFEGIPTATGSYLSNKNAYYIYLETIPNENIPSDALLSNYTYMRISNEGFDAWEDEDIAYITADENSGGTGQGGVILEKIDAATAEVLQGAMFKLVNKKTQQVVQENLRTNQSGQIRLAGIEPGQYELIEVKAPPGYKLDATPVPFEIKVGQTQTVRLKKENTRLENQLKVEKVDENNEAKRLAGAEFSLYDQKDNLIAKGVTNENGELLFSNLSPDGEYYLVETKAPDGYELDATKHPISFAGKADYTLTYRVKNTQQVQIGSIKIVKQDKESKKRLAGAEFQWKDTVTGKTGTVTVGTDGTVTIPNLAVNRTYELTETKAPAGYVLDKTVHKVTLTTAQANKVVTVTIDNVAQKGSIKIVKQDKESKKRLAGAEFQWKDTVTGKTGTVTVGTDGTVTIPNLAVNRTYELTETKAPAGYVLDKTVHKVTLTTAQANKVVTVTIDNVAQKGSIKIVKQDKESKKRLAGAEFQWKDTVTGKTGTVTVGTDGTVTIPNLAVNRTYELTETKAPAGYVLDKTVHKVTLTTAQANKVVTVTIDNVAQKGAIKIVKQDKDSKKRLTGAEFQWKDTVIGKTGIVTVGTDGTITIPNLSVNRTYEITETKAPTGYVLDKTVHKVTLTTAQANKVVTVTVDNVAQKGSIKIVKQDKDSKKRLTGAEFQWKDTVTGKTGTVTVGTDGTITIPNLSVNRTYEITETKAPVGYVLDKTVHKVTLTTAQANKVVTVTVDNVAQKGSIKIVKQDKDSKKRLTGAEFQWKDTVTGKTGTVTVGTDGTITIPNLSVNRTYEITETKAPVGYVLDKTVHKVTLTTAQANKVVTVTIDNTAQKGSLAIIKVDKDSRKRLAGAEFKWRDTVTGKVGIVVADKNGQALITDLPVNRVYEITEIKAPNGYILNNKTYRVTLTTNFADKIGYYTIENTAKKGSLAIIKVDKDSRKRLAGAEFKWRDTVTGKVGRVVADKNGQALITNLPVNRVYEITEIKAPNGYILNNKTYRVTLTTNFADKIGYYTIENTAKKGSLAIIKVDKDSRKRLAGAEFKWRDTVTGKVGRVVADKNGQALITNLPVNRVYEITEIKAPNGYILNNKTYRVTLTTNFADKIGYYTIENTAKKGSLAIIKVDKDSRKRLAGAEFKWRDTVTGKVGRVVADKNGQALITNLPVNRVYEITEIKAPNGYILNNKTYRVTLTTNFADKIGYYTIENTAKKGSLAIIKVDKDSRKRLAGAEFKWRDTVTGKVGRVVADKNGQALITNLPVNRVYEITEIKAPNGYILNNKTYRVTLTTNFADKIGYYTIENTAKKGSLAIIKVDKDSRKRLAGAEFKWRDTVTGKVGRVVADKNGQALITNLPVNRVYEITEIKAPNGYILNNKTYRVTLTTNFADKIGYYTIENVALRGNLKLVKQDSYSRQRLAGTQFRWRDTVNGNTGVVTTNSNGEAILYNFSVNRVYEITEIKAPNGYVLDRTVHKVLLPANYAGKTYTFIKNNRAQHGAIKIVKQDMHSRKRLAGAQFRLQDTTNNHTATFTANNNGEVLITGLAGDRIYNITEIKAPNGYILDNRIHRVDLRGQGGKTYTLIVNNEAKRAHLKLAKQDVDTRVRLAGAQFRWRDTVNGNTGVVTTNANGETTLQNFSVNRVYEITEIKAPNGYILDRTVHRVLLPANSAGKTYTFTKDNKANYGAIKIIKQDVETKVRLSGAVFEWRDTTNGYTQRVTTGWDGTVTISGLSVNRVYEIREIQAPAGYSRNTTPTRVSLTQNHAGQTIAIVRENRRIPVYNPPPPTYWPEYVPPVTNYNPPVYYNPPRYYYGGCVIVIVVVCW
ncbi:SpaA isopeptide-forming pilin-related protein [Enterococcus faecalis]|uniref:SpaA isopeptide-forming pilin-related protein n=3 Tax=Enterococcus faecalis TaxID=1351 RepID=UPI0024ADE1D4|nr:SpaA isopeptide-forming pilin-related protein [Enterococcus faecalis]WHK69223.1 SpaA isopeptide-forming pilin-related protein [Enterococcus faecalis]